MTDLTPSIHALLREKHAVEIPSTTTTTTSSSAETERTVNEFLKEAYRINSHIHSLLRYLQSIRQSYLSTAASFSSASAHTQQPRTPPSHPPSGGNKPQHLSDAERDSIDSSTALVLRDLSSSIGNLASAETLRQETESQLLKRKYGHPHGVLWRWAAGTDDGERQSSKTAEQVRDEDSAKTVRAVRESVLWFLRRALEEAVEMQRGMVEKRIERVREREKSVLYKVQERRQHNHHQQQQSTGLSATYEEGDAALGSVEPVHLTPGRVLRDQSSTMSEAEVAAIESELSPEQLQLFAEENDFMLKHYEDTLGQVQNAEKSLLEISSLQQSLVSHLSVQEEYISQLVTDAVGTGENVGRGNKELKRASERRSTAQMVFWGTVGLCTWLVVWDAIF